MIDSGTPNSLRARSSTSALSFQYLTPPEMRRESTNSGLNSYQGLLVDGAAIARVTPWLVCTLANTWRNAFASNPWACTIWSMNFSISGRRGRTSGGGVCAHAGSDAIQSVAARKAALSVTNFIARLVRGSRHHLVDRYD